MYEGDGESRVDIHLIDFANCNFSNSYTTPDEVEHDAEIDNKGYLLGISNLIAIIRLLRNGIVPVKELVKCELRKQLYGLCVCYESLGVVNKQSILVSYKLGCYSQTHSRALVVSLSLITLELHTKYYQQYSEDEFDSNQFQ